MTRKYALLGVADHFDVDLSLVTSPVFSPWVLAIIRLAFAVYTLATIITVIVMTALDGGTFGFFSYFTELSLIGLCSYFFITGYHTLAYARGLRSSGGKGYDGQAYPLQRWPRFLQFLHVLLFTTVVTFPFLVTIVYWALLAGPESVATPYNAWSNVSQHAMNAGYALFEIVLTHAGPSSGPSPRPFSSPLPWLHIPFMILILGGYLGIAYITHETQGFYSYGFLDPKGGPILAGYIVGIAVAICIIFLVVKGLCTLREKITPRPARDLHPRNSEAIEDWEEVELSMTESRQPHAV